MRDLTTLRDAALLWVAAHVRRDGFQIVGGKLAVQDRCLIARRPREILTEIVEPAVGLDCPFNGISHGVKAPCLHCGFIDSGASKLSRDAIALALGYIF